MILPGKKLPRIENDRSIANTAGIKCGIYKKMIADHWNYVPSAAATLVIMMFISRQPL